MYDSKITAEPAAQASPITARPRWRRGWIVALLVAVAGVAAWQWRASHPAPALVPAPAAPALSVSVSAASGRNLTLTVMGEGSIVAWQELVISAEIGGLRIVQAPIEEGMRVRAGDLLAALDDGVLAAQAAQAEASVNEAAAFLELARADLGRSEDLVRSQSTSRQVFETRQSAARQAEARLLVARARRDEAAARLAQTRILAPTDGVVSRVSVRIGAVSAPGQEMFRLIRDGRLELDARVPELELPLVEPGQPATVRHGGRAISAQVRAVAPVVAADSRLGLVHIALPPDSGLRPGMFARGEIRGGSREVVMVPASAVVFRDGAPRAFVLPEGADRVEMRRLTAGTRQDGMIEIVEGLAIGERVVTAGAGFLADGDLVRLIP